MNIQDYRKKIDTIDDELIRLFEERMDVAAAIAAYKKANAMPVKDPAREKEKILGVLEKTREDLKEYTPLLFQMLFEMSRSYQSRLNGEGTELTGQIRRPSKRRLL